MAETFGETTRLTGYRQINLSRNQKIRMLVSRYSFRPKSERGLYDYRYQIWKTALLDRFVTFTVAPGKSL